jgi:ectoine hydroxylase-related dioxygenase (phytanoyl-CoA dioxygenase family)
MASCSRFTTLFVKFCLLITLPNVAPFSFTATSGTGTALFSSASSAALDLLYQDQQEAMLRRSFHEQELLLSNNNNNEMKELLAPKVKAKPPKSGTGFGGGSANQANMDPAKRLATEQAKVMHKEGVIRINNVLTPEVTDKLREYVLDQQALAKVETDRDPTTSRTYYGVENKRKNRCDLQLSLLRGGFAADSVTNDDEFESFALADALRELLGENGTLRHLYENLVTVQGELYELAAVITDPGSNRQTVHPDLPYKSKAPLYVIFLALQDVTEAMGPTSFLMRTHTSKANDIFNSGDQSQKDNQLLKADCRLCTLKKGDAVMFDARTLHCGNANDAEEGRTRALFNFSFRNPEVQGSLGYKGSIRPGYEGALSLGDVSDALAAYGSGDGNPFAKYGNGIPRW